MKNNLNYRMEILSEVEERLNQITITTTRGNEFEIFAQQFFNQKLKHQVYTRQNISEKNKELYSELKETLGTENIDDLRDTGIDFFSSDGKNIYFVQVKYREDIKHFLTYLEIATFQGLIPLFPNYKFIIFTNCEGVNIKALKAGIIFYGRNYIIDNNFIFNRQLEFKPKEFSELERIKLFPIQKEVIKKITKTQSEMNTGYVSMAPGSGKTLIMFSVLRKLNKYKEKGLFKSLVLVPSLYLLSQIMNNFIKFSAIYKEFDFNFCLLGSDFSLDKKYWKKINSQRNRSNIRFFSDEENYSENKIKSIQEFINKDNGKPNICIATYHSALMFVNELNVSNFDTIMIDEAHKVYNNEFSILADINSEKRYYFTATPKIKQLNMFGHCFVEYSVIDAINDGIISDFKLINYCYDTSYDKDANDNESVALKIISDMKSKFPNDINKILTFHDTIKSSGDFSIRSKSTFSKNSYCKHMDGTTTIKDRKKIIGRFETNNRDISILSSAKVLAEGVDIPCVDSVVFVSPKESEVEIIQCIGRCLRRYKNKSCGYIIVPTLYDSKTMTPSDINFRTIYNVITKLNKNNINEEIHKRYETIYGPKEKYEPGNIIVKRDKNELNKLNLMILDKLMFGHITKNNLPEYKKVIKNVYKIKTVEDYRRKCKISEQLIKEPEKFFTDWGGWYEFFSEEKSLTYSDFRKILEDNGIKEFRDYKEKYIELNLPEYPNDFFMRNDVFKN